MAKFFEVWNQKTRVSRVLLILALVYCIGAVNFLLLALGVVHWLPSVYLGPPAYICFSVVSFAFALLLAAYHFSTFTIRRKRKYDITGLPQSEINKTA